MENDGVSRALQLAQRGDLEGLTRILRELQQRERERKTAMLKTRHDLGNLLSIATASVEAMLDAVAPITDARLNRVREILAQAGTMLTELTADANRSE